MTSKKKIKTKKKTPAKVSRQKKRTSYPKNNSRKSYNPTLVLLIMSLLVILAVLYNNKEKTDINPRKESKNEKIDSKKRMKDETRQVQDKKDIQKDKDDNKLNDLKNVKIYFAKFNENTEEISYIPAIRKIQPPVTLNKVLKLLIKGVNQNEKKQGYITAISEKTIIKKIRIKDKIAIIDFSSSFRNSFILNSINQVFYTATQFPEVNAIVLQVNGKRIDRVSDGHGRFFEWPMKRRF